MKTIKNTEDFQIFLREHGAGNKEKICQITRSVRR